MIRRPFFEYSLWKVRKYNICEYCKIFENLNFKGHLWTTASELNWFKMEEIIEKTEKPDVSEPNETSKMKPFTKIVASM